MHIKERRISYFDSLGECPFMGGMFRGLSRFLSDFETAEHRVSGGDWNFYIDKSQQIQQDGTSCAVCLCFTAEMIARGLPPFYDFSVLLQNGRHRIGIAILNKRI